MSSNFTVVYDACVLYLAAAGQLRPSASTSKRTVERLPYVGNGQSSTECGRRIAGRKCHSPIGVGVLPSG